MSKESKPDITITRALPTEADRIAPMIMEAMNHECCQWFAGPDHTLDDFREAMTRLIRRDDSQYSYLNTLTAHCDDQLAGILVGYDGADLHRLRQAFIDEAKRSFDIDYSGMADETGPGEFYLDSLCVDGRYRGHGIASRLLRAAIDHGRQLGLPATGLLVDTGNPKAERLYTRLGFRCVGTAAWGSHPMKHMQYRY